MREFSLIGIFICLLLISIKGNVSSVEQYYTIRKPDHVEYLHSCCDWNKLKSRKFCGSSSGRSLSDLNTLTRLFGDKLTCNKGLIQNVRVNITQDDRICEHNFLVESDKSERIFLNGITYPRDSYCVHNINGLPDHLSLIICSQGCFDDSPCYKKCCGLHQSLTYDKNRSGKCISAKDKQFHFLQNLASKVRKIHILSSKLTVNSNFNFRGSCGRQPDTNRTKFWLSQKGILEFELGYNNYIQIKDYCVDQLFNENGSSLGMTAHYCHSEFVNHLWNSFFRQLIYTSISTVVLGVSIWVFFLIRGEHSIHGWTQFAFLTAAFLFYLTRVIMNAVFLHRLARNYENGIVTAVILQFSERLFWNGLFTNVVGMNSHIFWTFLKLKPEMKQVNREELKTLVISLVACWTAAGVVAIVEVILIFTTEDDTKRENLLHLAFYIIDVPICGVTLLLALGTSFILIRRLRNRTSTSPTKTSSSTQIVATIVRLFCVTGLIWTSVTFEIHVKQDAYSTGWLWEIFHFLFYINGVVISFVFVCNQRTLKSLRKRFPEYLPLRGTEKFNVIKYSSSQKSDLS